jgi:3-deoxy-manno-octulosonate cytidylyltransferase (CMP-KDO synthetase)
MRSCVLIPARFGSSRYPGKPLVPLLGKPMILWVAELASQAVGIEHVYVATEDQRIVDVVEAAGFKAVMTSDQALTGTDRLAEAAEQLDYDIFVNVQGDEPVLDPQDIVRCVREKEAHPDRIINGFCRIGPEEDPASPNIPKVIANESGQMIYMSRSPLPGFKDPAMAPAFYMKQVCIYGFTLEELRAFRDFGRKSAVERCEDIEILRFLELGRTIWMYETSGGSLAVDVPGDVAGVEAVLRAKAGL